MSDRQIAADLAEARRSGRLTDPGEGWPPRDEAQAEAVRDAAFAALGERGAGYKIGATSPEAQQIIGCDGPFYGAMPASKVLASGDGFDMPDGTLGIECEFAFRIGRDQPAGTDGYDGASVAALVESCHPALEVVGRRTRGTGFPPYLEAVGDMALNVAFVHGATIDGWEKLGLAETPVVGAVDGVEAKRGSGSLVLGNPLNALAWLANRLARDGKALKTGDWVSTGTCLGVVPAAKGTEISGIYGDFAKVTMRLR
ncbi:MAG: 2-keto-4-pentenoate hydratase [Flavobacteriaceae bacterium]